ncbi:VOC family protein [Actinoplanes siamensis]|uniref:VOC family protein n=1 Tax=Actinoplanes siamensis TaxID=1223317 RepID=UPI0023B2C91B|nr:VOC family protein [Actinoplanes siamensis]
MGALHHVAVQTSDIDSAIAWYTDFFGCVARWSMESGFSPQSCERLPGLARVVEMASGDMRFHLFTRGPGHDPADLDSNQFQHVCIRVDSPEELSRWRDKYMELYNSGRYVFRRPEPAGEIDIDADGMQSFYAYDVNGLEIEMSYMPGGDDGSR